MHGGWFVAQEDRFDLDAPTNADIGANTADERADIELAACLDLDCPGLSDRAGQGDQGSVPEAQAGVRSESLRARRHPVRSRRGGSRARATVDRPLPTAGRRCAPTPVGRDPGSSSGGPEREPRSCRDEANAVAGCH